MRLAALCLALIAGAGPVAATESESGPLELAQLVTGTPQQKLQRLLRPHAYFGDRVTDDIRAATGDPNIAVIDRRWRWGEIYSCNYVFMHGRHRGRTLVCE
ncbi:MAG: hypothetical protein BroJett030_19600 [Alphaproteobacteria bacterium]|nr:MAG: hypothetical protein BroJett030_19600 [Alphaproteobacteria bacterium]